jgi:tetratricopeptide (TPR) repeat protein
MMKIFVILTISMAAAFGCSKAPETVRQDQLPAANDRSQTVLSHSTENMPPSQVKPGEKTKWTQNGTPIDTKQYDSAIAASEIALKKSPNDTKLKKDLADAYFVRAMALTDPARQYASALGDFRRTVKYDPTNTEAKDWIKKIVDIYDGMNREYPKEGEEPPPLPFTKGK